MFHFEINTNQKIIESARLALVKAQKRYDDLISEMKEDPKVSDRSLITCKVCKKRSQARVIQYSNFYWYEKPHGCTDGDTWHFGGYLIFCPKCGEKELVHKSNKFHSEIDVAEINILKGILEYAIKGDDVHYIDGHIVKLNGERW